MAHLVAVPDELEVQRLPPPVIAHPRYQSIHRNHKENANNLPLLPFVGVESKMFRDEPSISCTGYDAEDAGYDEADLMHFEI